MECHSELLFYSGTCLYRGNWPSKTIWDEPMQCQCDAKNTPVAVIQDRKGTPFEHFPEVLSTNQRAGFLALDQSEASISARFGASVESEPIQSITNSIKMDQCRANSVPMQCHLKLLYYSGTCLYRGNWPSKTIWDEPMHCHCATAKSLCHWITTWTKFPPMDVKNSQWIVNSPMPCHLNHSCVTSTTGITIRIICHPVFIVQLKFMGPLLGHLPL